MKAIHFGPVGIILPAFIAMMATVTTARAQTPADVAATQGQVTFAKDVAPILQQNCQECHQPNSIAPMSLITYQEVRPWGGRHQGACGGASDAAVARRPQRRRAEVQERHVAYRPAGGIRSSPGSTAGRCRAI